jgi:hypothetical protein
MVQNALKMLIASDASVARATDAGQRLSSPNILIRFHVTDALLRGDRRVPPERQTRLSVGVITSVGHEKCCFRR